jgi:hypothetical protein
MLMSANWNQRTSGFYENKGLDCLYLSEQKMLFYNVQDIVRTKNEQIFRVKLDPNKKYSLEDIAEIVQEERKKFIEKYKK